MFEFSTFLRERRVSVYDFFFESGVSLSPSSSDSRQERRRLGEIAKEWLELGCRREKNKEKKNASSRRKRISLRSFVALFSLRAFESPNETISSFHPIPHIFWAASGAQILIIGLVKNLGRGWRWM